MRPVEAGENTSSRTFSRTAQARAMPKIDSRWSVWQISGERAFADLRGRLASRAACHRMLSKKTAHVWCGSGKSSTNVRGGMLFDNNYRLALAERVTTI